MLHHFVGGAQQDLDFMIIKLISNKTLNLISIKYYTYIKLNNTPVILYDFHPLRGPEPESRGRRWGGITSTCDPRS